MIMPHTLWFNLCSHVCCISRLVQRGVKFYHRKINSFQEVCSVLFGLCQLRLPWGFQVNHAQHVNANTFCNKCSAVLCEKAFYVFAENICETSKKAICRTWLGMALFCNQSSGLVGLWVSCQMATAGMLSDGGEGCHYRPPLCPFLLSSKRA